MGQPGRPEQPLDPAAGPVPRLAVELRKLRRAAGSPTYRELAGRTGGAYSAATLSRAASGVRLPTLSLTLAYAEACGADHAEWAARWRSAAAELRGAGPRPAERWRGSPADQARAPAPRTPGSRRPAPRPCGPVRDPAVRDPAVRDPAVRDPAVRHPGPRHTAVRDPAVADPSRRDPAGRDAVGRNSRGRDSVGRDPAGWDPAGGDAVGKDVVGRDSGAGRNPAVRGSGSRSMRNRPVPDAAVRDRPGRVTRSSDRARGDAAASDGGA